MPALAGKQTVIARDLRGAGASQESASGYDTRSMAEDIHQLVLSLGLRDIDLVGHDVGVAVAYAYAAGHRSEVRHLALLDVPPQGTAAFTELSAKSWNHAFQKQPVLPEALVAGRERLYMIEGFFKPLAVNYAAFTPADIDEYVRAYSAPNRMHCAFEWYRAFDQDIEQNRDELKRKLEMPVLMMGGDRSGGPLMLTTGREIASDFRVHIIKNCGHWLMDEQPEAVATVLRNFID